MQFVRRRVRRGARMRRARGRPAGQRDRSRREARIDSRQRAPVRLVLPMRIVVQADRDQLREFGRGLHEALRQRQFRAKLVHRIEVMLERDRCLRPDRVFERLGDDERIAVAIAADPRAHAQERRHRDGGTEDALQFGGKRLGQPRHLRQERVPIVGEPILDLVVHRELRDAQHRRLPQRDDLPVEAGFPFRLFLRRQLRAVAPHHEPRDFALAVEDALALHLGRMRSQHRRHQRVGQPFGERAGLDARCREMRERRIDAALLRRRSGERVRAAAAILVDVLGKIREVGEIGECPDHIERGRDRQVVQECGEFGAHAGGFRGVCAPEADRRLANGLDPRIRLFARLRAQHVAQQPAEQARVFLQRKVAVDVGVGHRSKYRAAAAPQQSSS